MRQTALQTGIAGAARLRLVLAVAAATLVAAPASAESVYCSELRAQIAQASGGGSPRFRAAAAQQEAELARASAYARERGCERQQFLFFGQAPPPQCGELVAKIGQMRANLASLRARAGDDGRRQALIARYDQLCRQRAAEPNILEQLFGAFRSAAPAPLEEPPLQPQSERVLEEPHEEERPGGGSEAVCVRHCDGGFFPISYSARRGNLDDLDELCKAMCPNAEASLYTKSPWREIDTAVSAEGEPYTDLPNALKFQKTYDPSCSCRARDKSAIEALGEAERMIEASYAKDVPVSAEQAEQLSRPQPYGGVSVRPVKTQSSRRDAKAVEAPPPAVAPKLETRTPQSVGSAEGEVRQTVGPDGATRRVRVVAPAL
jgi:hypothetical protein